MKKKNFSCKYDCKRVCHEIASDVPVIESDCGTTRQHPQCTNRERDIVDGLNAMPDGRS